MRVLLDCRSVFLGMGGIGRATAELARALPAALQAGDELLLLVGTRRPDEPLAPPAVASAASAPQPVREVPVEAAMLDPAFEQARLPGLLDELGVDVYHGACFAVPIVAAGAARVATVHDVVFRRHPELVERGLREYLDRWTRVACDVAETVVTVSEFSRREIAALYGRPADAIEVVPNGVDDAFRRVVRRPAPGRPYLLYVGSIEPKKNVVPLLRAFGALLRAAPDLPHVLVLVGGPGGAPFDLEAAVRDVPGIAPRVHALGRVPDEALRELLGSADLFVYPSEYEGFGLPPLEAMAAGVPTVVSERAALPEVVGDGARRVDPGDPVAFGRALLELLRDPAAREDLAHRGRRRAQAFTWGQAASRLAALYRRAWRASRPAGVPRSGAASRPPQPAEPEPPALRVLAGGRA